MLRKITFQTKSLVLVLLFFAFWWVTPVVVKQWTRVLFYEFQAPSWTAVSYLRDLQHFFTLKAHSKNDLIEAGIDMARLNAAYSLQNQKQQYLEREIERLESFFNLPAQSRHRYEVARVLKRDMTSWWQHLIIRKGSNHGIERGMAVVYQGGVAGRIIRVDLYTATVELISSPGFRTAAQFEGDSRPVEFQGGINPGLMMPSARISNVPADIDVSYANPRRLTSSSLGGVFPDGLTLGNVYNLEVGGDGLFKRGKVRLDPALAEIREIAVLIPLEEKSDEQ